MIKFPKSIHLQYYTFLDEMLKPLPNYLVNLYIFPKLFPFIFGRLNLIIGYLHSDYSNQLVIEKGDNYNEFKIHELKNKNTDIVIEKTTFLLNKTLKTFFYI